MVAYFSSEASCAVELLSEELQSRRCEVADATADVASGVLAGAEPCQGCGPLSAAGEAAKLQSNALLSEASEAAEAAAGVASGVLSSVELRSERAL